MSDKFNAAFGQPAIKTANIYFHRAHAVAAQELSGRITADANGQAFATRTQGDLVRSPNDVNHCDAVLLDRALGAEQLKTIIELHDRYQLPYEVHHLVYNPDANVFEQEKQGVQEPKAATTTVSDTTPGESGGPRPTDPPAGHASAGAGSAGQQRTSRGAGRGASREAEQ